MGKTHSTAHTHISLLFTQSGTGLSLLLGARAATRAELSPLGALLTYRAEKGSATADKDFHLTVIPDLFTGENSLSQDEEVVPKLNLIPVSLCCWCGYQWLWDATRRHEHLAR